MYYYNISNFYYSFALFNKINHNYNSYNIISGLPKLNKYYSYSIINVWQV